MTFVTPSLRVRGTFQRRVREVAEVKEGRGRRSNSRHRCWSVAAITAVELGYFRKSTMDDVIAGNAVSVTVNVRNTAKRWSHVSFRIGNTSAATRPISSSLSYFPSSQSTAPEDEIQERSRDARLTFLLRLCPLNHFQPEHYLFLLLEYCDWRVLLPTHYHRNYYYHQNTTTAPHLQN